MAEGSPASELEFLELIDRHFSGSGPGLSLGRGDDCAVLECPSVLALSTDLFLEDVHFRRSYFGPGDIGHKALAVNVSDVAGMGCCPLGFSLGLMVPGGAGLPGGFWDGLFTGMAALAGEHGLVLTGGDLSRAPLLGMCVTIWGEPGPGGRVLRREARAGDVLVGCGELGLVRVGLAALERGGAAAAGDFPQAVAAHLRPVPQVAAGLALAAQPAVRGAMDVSDGLAMDLARLLGADRGAELGADLELPPQALHPEVSAWCAATGEDPGLFAYRGGEDYALLAACEPAGLEEILRAVPGSRAIGRVRAGRGVTVNGLPAPGAGFDHFAG